MRIFTVMAILCSLVVANAADVNVLATDDLATKIGDAAGSGTVRVQVGTYVLSTELTIPAGVTVKGGYDATFAEETRTYPGATTDKEKMTILDGNSLLTAPAQKHRVAKVSGTLEGCVIRNGHIRNGNGGGVLIEDGGTVQNCIIKGNVAMNVGSTTDALGGGVYLNGADAKLINSVVAFNMANNGYGVAGAGQMINNTITANTYAPVAVEVAGATYKHFKHWRVTGSTPWGPLATNQEVDGTFDPDKHLDDKTITVSTFRLAQTQTTTSQYAVFAAAMDLLLKDEMDGAAEVQNIYFENTLFSALTDPSTNEAVTERMGFTAVAATDVLFRLNTSQGLIQSGIDYIYASSARANQPMTYVTWFGGLAYSVWLGGSLPTEGQWELAARSKGDGTPETYQYAGSDILNDVACHSTHGNALQEVALLQANGIELYDMSGNVWEWCADWINSTSTATTGVYYPEYTSMTDPLWSTGSARVARGGGYGSAGGYLSLAVRNAYSPTHVNGTVGFRPVLVP